MSAADDPPPDAASGLLQPTPGPAAAEQIRSMLNTHPGWVCGVDEEMRYVYVNQSFCELAQRPADAIIGRTADEVLGAKGSAARWDMLRRSLAGETDLFAERAYVDVQGHARIAWTRYHCVEYGTPARRYSYSIGFDITELRLAQQRLSVVTQDIGIGLWEYSVVRGVLDCNEALLGLVGCTAADVQGEVRLWISGFVDPQDAARYRQRLAQLEAGVVPAGSGEFRARHRDGRTIWFQERMHVLERDAQGRLLRVAGVVQDITAAKARELELEQLNHELESRIAQRTQALAQATREAERANAAKSEFVSHMSHELRKPLNAILGFGQLLQMGALPAEEAQQVHQIVRAGHQLLALVDESLDLAAVESGRIALHTEAVALAPLLADCCSQLDAAARAAGVEIDTRGVPAAACVHADRRRLQQVLLNLLTNAIKYNARQPGRVVICARRGEGPPPAWVLELADTGAGMDAAQLARVFEPFERLGAEHTGTQGSGIGLTIVRRLVEHMGGDIEVSSMPGVGSVFCVRLPAVPA